MIAKLPGTTFGGQWNQAFLHVTDIMQTFLEVAAATYPQSIKGRPIKQPIGKSLMPILNGATVHIRENEGVGYELFEIKAYIQGEWKLLRLPEPFGEGTWQLYNIELDPGEIRDVAEEHPEVQAAMIEAWQQYAVANDVFDHKGRFDALYRQAYGGE